MSDETNPPEGLGARRDLLAVASLVAAVASVLAFLLVPLRLAIAVVPTLCVAAIVLSMLAVRRIGAGGSGGRGLATAGFLVSGACLAAFGVLLVLGGVAGSAS